MRSSSCLLICTALVATAFVPGCGGDDGGGPEPVTGVEISPNQADMEIGYSLELTVKVAGGSTKKLNWYVNGILDGNATFGTISHVGPVTYTAPSAVPDPARVLIKAISVEDTAKLDSCVVYLSFTAIHVNAATGNDLSGTGCINLPVKTITHGLEVAEAGMTVLVAPGVYDQANGEVFAISVPPEVALVGEDWETCIIRGHQAEDYNQTIDVSGNGCTFRKFTLEQGNPADPAWNLAVYAWATNALIDSIRVLDRGNYAVMRLTNATSTVVQNCLFYVDDDERRGKGFELTGIYNTGLILRSCTAFGFGQGIWLVGATDALIEGCILTGNDYGAIAAAESPVPDFGGGARGSAGGNLIRDNIGCGLQNHTERTIYAKYNTWTNDPPVAGVDFCNIGAGSIIIE
jgi:hypothetical protein